jgi:hypothetical protein
MDYGTGHETSFALFLCILTLIGYFSDEKAEIVERDLVLLVFLQYIRLCWRLQDAYNLEPAGSHGVWGLDDSHFIPYIFGSAQLRGSLYAITLHKKCRSSEETRPTCDIRIGSSPEEFATSQLLLPCHIPNSSS